VCAHISASEQPGARPCLCKRASPHRHEANGGAGGTPRSDGPLMSGFASEPGNHPFKLFFLLSFLVCRVSQVKKLSAVLQHHADATQAPAEQKAPIPFLGACGGPGRSVRSPCQPSQRIQSALGTAVSWLQAHRECGTARVPPALVREHLLPSVPGSKPFPAS